MLTYQSWTLTRIWHSISSLNKSGKCIFTAEAFFESMYYNDLVAQLVKNPPTIRETPVRFLGREDLLEKG